MRFSELFSVLVTLLSVALCFATTISTNSAHIGNTHVSSNMELAKSGIHRIAYGRSQQDNVHDPTFNSHSHLKYEPEQDLNPGSKLIFGKIGRKKAHISSEVRTFGRHGRFHRITFKGHQRIRRRRRRRFPPIPNFGLPHPGIPGVPVNPRRQPVLFGSPGPLPPLPRTGPVDAPGFPIPRRPPGLPVPPGLPLPPGSPSLPLPQGSTGSRPECEPCTASMQCNTRLCFNGRCIFPTFISYENCFNMATNSSTPGSPDTLPEASTSTGPSSPRETTTLVAPVTPTDPSILTSFNSTGEPSTAIGPNNTMDPNSPTGRNTTTGTPPGESTATDSIPESNPPSSLNTPTATSLPFAPIPSTPSGSSPSASVGPLPEFNREECNPCALAIQCQQGVCTRGKCTDGTSSSENRCFLQECAKCTASADCITSLCFLNRCLFTTAVSRAKCFPSPSPSPGSSSEVTPSPIVSPLRGECALCDLNSQCEQGFCTRGQCTDGKGASFNRCFRSGTPRPSPSSSPGSIEPNSSNITSTSAGPISPPGRKVPEVPTTQTGQNPSGAPNSSTETNAPTGSAAPDDSNSTAPIAPTVPSPSGVRRLATGFNPPSASLLPECFQCTRPSQCYQGMCTRRGCTDGTRSSFERCGRRVISSPPDRLLGECVRCTNPIQCAQGMCTRRGCTDGTRESYARCRPRGPAAPLLPECARCMHPVECAQGMCTRRGCTDGSKASFRRCGPRGPAVPGSLRPECAPCTRPRQCAQGMCTRRGCTDGGIPSYRRCGHRRPDVRPPTPPMPPMPSPGGQAAAECDMCTSGQDCRMGVCVRGKCSDGSPQSILRCFPMEGKRECAECANSSECSTGLCWWSKCIFPTFNSTRKCFTKHAMKMMS